MTCSAGRCAPLLNTQSASMPSLAGYSCDSLPQAAILATQVLGAKLQEERWLLRHVGLVLLVGHDVKEDGHRRRSILQGVLKMLEVSPVCAVQHSLDVVVDDEVAGRLQNYPGSQQGLSS